MARRKSEWDKTTANPKNISECNSCETERGNGRWITTSDGRETIKDRSDDD